ncbi:phosphate regulon sensor histidine kinase PhoR [Arhodomonas sp. SL1]|uniref:phosphate regulon sensor histidine kinase PhoR n=1 Tax=Arhodomonas sp. SL1 TaxID=3425691 RepID=UPI003F882B08
MMPRNPWPEAWLRLVAVVAAALLVGLLLGRPWLVLSLVLLAWIVRQGWLLMRLERWARRGQRMPPPELPGLWGDLAGQLERHRRGQVRRRHGLVALLHRFRASIDALPDAVLVIRSDGGLEWWNPRATEFLGLRWPVDQGQRPGNLLRHPEFTRFLREGGGSESVTVPSPLDEDLILEIRMVSYGDGRRMLVARDVTRIHRLEGMRRDFVANVTHELRTPLTVIQGLSETLAEYGAEPEDLANSLGMIDTQAQRMRRLIDDLLVLSRLETAARPARTEPVTVAALLRELVAETETMDEGAHAIHLEAEEDLRVRGNEQELRSAFSNLLVNAVKYTPAGGRIDVRWQRSGEGASLCVADTGPGIPAHHIPRLTERFYRVDKGRSQAAGGTGLGLAIVKHVLSRHGARLEIRSTPGQGSTFCCVFPEYQRSGADRARSFPRS